MEFLYLSRDNPEVGQVVQLWPNISTNGLKFDPKRPYTTFMTHGFASNCNTTWIQHLKDNYLKQVCMQRLKILNYLPLLCLKYLLNTFFPVAEWPRKFTYGFCSIDILVGFLQSALFLYASKSAQNNHQWDKEKTFVICTREENL